MTNKENLMRGIGVAAVNSRKTHCSQNHLYDIPNTLVRKGKRVCRTCNRNSTRAIRAEARLSKADCIYEAGGIDSRCLTCDRRQTDEIHLALPTQCQGRHQRTGKRCEYRATWRIHCFPSEWNKNNVCVRHVGYWARIGGAHPIHQTHAEWKKEYDAANGGPMTPEQAYEQWREAVARALRTEMEGE